MVVCSKMKEKYLLIFGYFIIFVCALWFVVPFQAVVSSMVSMYFDLPIQNGWSHHDVLKSHLVWAAPYMVILFLYIVISCFFCARLKKKDNTTSLAKMSFIQLIFGLILFVACGVGVTINTACIAKHALISRFDVVSAGQKWEAKSNVLKKHNPKSFQAKQRAEIVEHTFYFVYFLIGLIVSFFVVRSVKPKEESR